VKTWFVTFVFIFVTITGQSQPRAALSVGSDTYIPYEGEGVSITESRSVAVIPYQQEATLQQGTEKQSPNQKHSGNKEGFILFTGILIAIAIYFSTRKNRQANYVLTQKLETEEELELKKEMWEHMATSGDDETKDLK